MNFIKKNWYQLFKYSVYLAVLTNVFLFLRKDLNSVAHRFEGEVNFSNWIEAYTSTIDTAAWVILLILFELETYVISDEKLKGGLQWIFKFIRGICYIFIASSFFGYISNFNWLQGFEKTNITALCEVTGESWMVELDEFKTIKKEDCATLAEGKTFFIHPEKKVYTDDKFLKDTNWLSIVDILNSLSWILVVLVLEIDVFLQLRKRFVGKVVTISKYIKNMLYFILFCAAVYWGVFGDFLEFWDAFLWIVAFVFIEMNLFDWKQNNDERLSVNGKRPLT